MYIYLYVYIYMYVCIGGTWRLIFEARLWLALAALEPEGSYLSKRSKARPHPLRAHTHTHTHTRQSAPRPRITEFIGLVLVCLKASY